VALLIGGRNPAKGAALACELGNASAVALEMNSSSPLASVEGALNAVFCFVHDGDNNMLTDCIARGIAYGDITRGPAEQIRGYVGASLGETRAPVLFSANWMAGVPAVLAMHMAEEFSHVDAIDLSLLFYGADRVGPDSASAGSAISEPFVARIDGAWRGVRPMSDGRRVRFPSGLTRNVYRVNMGDVTTLAQASRAANVAVRLGLDGSRTMTFMRMMMKIGLWSFIAKFAGQPGSKPGKGARHEIVIEVKGRTAAGKTLAKRASLLDPQGQAHLTALGSLLAIEAIAGLGRTPLRPGIAVPETAPDAARLIAVLAAEGVDLRFE
jgi:saccharopine dehydrogenase-like NADP-dependent oxidoreductase